MVPIMEFRAHLYTTIVILCIRSFFEGTNFVRRLKNSLRSCIKIKKNEVTMTMAIYHFSNQIISRKKQQSTIAAAAYRSGERLIDERTSEGKFYKRKVKPITHILAPNH